MLVGTAGSYKASDRLPSYLGTYPLPALANHVQLEFESTLPTTLVISCRVCNLTFSTSQKLKFE